MRLFKNLLNFADCYLLTFTVECKGMLTRNQLKETKYVIRKPRRIRIERKMRGCHTQESQIQAEDCGSSSSSKGSPIPVVNSNGSCEKLSSTNTEEESSLMQTLDAESPDPTTNNPKLKEALQVLEKETDCPITQNKWHRKFGPPNSWKGPPPPRGCEIFVGKIPRDCFENELVSILQKAGKIYEMRLMMETSTINRGFAYVKYVSAIEADTAISILNNYEIRSKQFLGVMKSVDNNRLFIGGISKSRKQEELFSEMTRLTDDVLAVILYSDACDKTKNRGFAFVEYKNHLAASIARQKLMKNPPILWGTNQVKVDWAEPEREVDEQTMLKVVGPFTLFNLFAKNKIL